MFYALDLLGSPAGGPFDNESKCIEWGENAKLPPGAVLTVVSVDTYDTHRVNGEMFPTVYLRGLYKTGEKRWLTDAEVKEAIWKVTP